jgi:hypothetical protein
MKEPRMKHMSEACTVLLGFSRAFGFGFRPNIKTYVLSTPYARVCDIG